MKISAYILANRAQEVPVPVPGEVVEATIEPVGTVNFAYYCYNSQIPGEAFFTTTRTPGMQGDTSSGEYYLSQGYDCPPCNCGNNGSSGEVSLYHQDDALWNGRHYIATEDHLFTTGGSFKLTFGNQMAPGNYVFEIIHYIGTDAVGVWTGTDIPMSRVIVVGNKGTVIKAGTHGVVEGTVYPEEIVYQGAKVNPYQAPYYRGRVISVRMRYAFTVSEGDTEKVFTWGDNGDLSMRELWDYLLMYEQNSSGVKDGYVWLNSHFTLRVKVYKAR